MNLKSTVIVVNSGASTHAVISSDGPASATRQVLQIMGVYAGGTWSVSVDDKGNIKTASNHGKEITIAVRDVELLENVFEEIKF